MIDKLRPVCLMVMVALFLGPRVAPAAQQPALQKQFEKLAEKVTTSVRKTAAVNMLLAQSSGCLGQPEICGDFDAALRALLQAQIPGAKFIDREDAIKHLANHGFLTIDAYLGALNSVGRDAGAEVVISEKFEQNRNSCNLRATVTDAKHLYWLEEFSVGIPCAEAKTTTLSLLKDPFENVFLVVPLPASSGAAPVDEQTAYPKCLSCPDPHYTEDAKAKGIQGTVQIVVTVTEMGTVENARVLGLVELGLAMASVRAVSTWKLKPAAGPDGKPLRVRIPVEVTFRLIN